MSQGSLRVWDGNRLLGPLPSASSPSADVDGLLRELDELAIERACVTHTEALLADPVAGNGPLRTIAAQPDRLEPVWTMVPGDEPVPRAVERLRDAGVRMVRLCPLDHRFRPDGRQCRELLAQLAAAGITVAMELEQAPIEVIDRLLEDLPALRLLLLRTGYRRLRELAELLEHHSGAHVDTSTLSGHRGVEWLAHRVGAERIVFGTGAPLSDDGGPRFQLDHLDLPVEHQQLIAAGNLERLLRGAS